MKEYIISIDIAKSIDRTVVSIGRKCIKYLSDGRALSYLLIEDLQMVERMPYPDLARYIRKLDLHTDLRGNNDLLIDSTGVGEAVCDTLEDIGCRPLRIIFTGGNEAHVRGTSFSSGEFNTRITYNVPKEGLIDALRLSMQQGRLVIAEGIDFEDDIKRQFSHFTGIMGRRGNVKYGNDSDDIHDDIVCSMAMAVWWFMQGEGARSDFKWEPELETDNRALRHKGKRGSSADYDFDEVM